MECLHGPDWPSLRHLVASLPPPGGGIIVICAVLFPEFTDLGVGDIDPAINVVSPASSSFPALRCCRP
jgi:hypothetical protein